MKTLTPAAPAATTQPQLGPSCGIVEITPEMARDWLENHNSDNYRKIAPSAVQRLKDDIVGGRWRLTTSAIGFDTDGELVNGQHRLTAIAETGLSCLAIVVKGMASGSRKNPSEDTGLRRTTAQHLMNRGYVSATAVASVTRNLLRLKYTGGLTNSLAGRVTDSLVVEVVDNNPEIQYAACTATGVPRIATPSVFGTWFWLASLDDADLAKECVDIFADRKEATTSHPFIKLRELLHKHRLDSKGRGRMMNEHLQLLYFMGAWEKAKKGKSVTRLNAAKQIKVSDLADEKLQQLC